MDSMTACPPGAAARSMRLVILKKQSARSKPTPFQLGQWLGRGRLNKVVDGFHGRLDPLFGQVREHRIPPRVMRQITLGDHHAGQTAQDPNRFVQFFLVRLSLSKLGHFCFPEQVGDKRFTKFRRIVLGGGLQSVKQRCNRRCASRFLQGCNSRRFGVLRHTRKPLQLYSRHSLWKRGVQSKRSNRIQPVQMTGEICRAALQGSRSQYLQASETLSILGKEGGDLRLLRLGQTCSHTTPQALPRTFPDATNEAFKGRKTRQNYLVFNQPIGRPLNEVPRPVLPSPAKSIYFSSQPKDCLRRTVKIPEAGGGSNYSDMALVGAGRWVQIPLKFKRLRTSQLSAEVSNHGVRYIGAPDRKSPQESHAAQEDCKSQPVGCPAHLPNRGLFGITKVKVLRQMFLGGCDREAAISLSLKTRQKPCRHNVQNSIVLKHGSAALKTQEKAASKHICETKEFCNKIRTTERAAA